MYDIGVRFPKFKIKNSIKQGNKDGSGISFVKRYGKCRTYTKYPRHRVAALLKIIYLKL